MLEVRFVEASRTASRELGISGRGRKPTWHLIPISKCLIPVPARCRVLRLLSGAEPFGTLLARVLEGGTNVDVMLRALESRALARRLAEPNLVTMSGETRKLPGGRRVSVPDQLI